MAGCIKSVINEIGKGARHVDGHVSFDSSRSGLQDILNISSLTWRCFQAAAKKVHDNLRSGSTKAVVATRHFDSSPVMMKFGKMARLLMEHARYLENVPPPPDRPDGYGTVKLVSYAEYRKEFPRTSPEMGVVELLAMELDIAWATFDEHVGADWGIFLQHHHQQCTSPPAV